jgi:glycosyltransferase involved in cell wall biosynthesis
MIVTNVGGLAEIVPDDVVGYVTDTNVESLAEAFVKFYSEGTAERMRSNMVEERKRFSWEAMADCLTEVYKMTK